VAIGTKKPPAQETSPSTSKDSSPVPIVDDTATASSRASSAEQAVKKVGGNNKDQITFFSGNPFVEKVQGILHFYKEK